MDIRNISDTARLTATYRADESARPDALFRDPLASRLAGEGGRTLRDTAPSVLRSGWPIVTRTKLVDDLIAAAVREGCDRVLNLAAGLDTRPYRLDLPSGLVWVEVDLPELVDEKNAALAAEQPGCKLRRHGLDLRDRNALVGFLDEALGARVQRGSSAPRALVLTEGLLIYLGHRTVADLAHALARPEIHWWITDVTLGGAHSQLASSFEDGPRFDPADGIGFFEEHGWHPLEVENLVVQAGRFRRAPQELWQFAELPQQIPRSNEIPWSGVVRFRQEATIGEV
ncbi:class I SAM-dependent methyltransferase [Nocardia vermiculata]|uniref:S-adenosyl-L-methionine-dependent methyltransferase n=1 Tax=Nocardia vermiculata TaxID=257274 RepID=A0A846XWJ1_9NOCA|nr:SAM-dependent methyltransferase [Nocardia vermiculata]NKY50322.1 class I SAM-dependent methyltransferase [Nocardia vermiculata]